jgi:hypothetical protein
MTESTASLLQHPSNRRCAWFSPYAVAQVMQICLTGNLGRARPCSHAGSRRLAGPGSDQPDLVRSTNTAAPRMAGVVSCGSLPFARHRRRCRVGVDDLLYGDGSLVIEWPSTFRTYCPTTGCGSSSRWPGHTAEIMVEARQPPIALLEASAQRAGGTADHRIIDPGPH